MASTSQTAFDAKCEVSGGLAVIDCFGILDDAKIRRYFELGCEVKGLGRSHVKRIKDSVREGGHNSALQFLCAYHSSLCAYVPLPLCASTLSPSVPLSLCAYHSSLCAYLYVPILSTGTSKSTRQVKKQDLTPDAFTV